LGYSEDRTLDIQTLGAWGELLGGISGLAAAVGVILTLLYLARQIHQNTDQTRAQIAHGLMTALRGQGDVLKRDAEAEVYFKGMFGTDELSDLEEWQCRNINNGFFRVFEEAYLHHRAGRLEDAYWDSLSGQLSMVLAIPFIRRDWDLLSSGGDRFNTKFIEYGNSLNTAIH
jgi:hypothetical protein